jgi:hypothetical protein
MAHFDTLQDRMVTELLEAAKLSDGFSEQFHKHPVPLEEAAIKALSNNAPALDAYLRLAYLGRTEVAVRNRLPEALLLQEQASRHVGPCGGVYPAAKFEVTEAGVVLKPSPPPVSPRLIAAR